jgi:hypothetical protein
MADHLWKPRTPGPCWVCGEETEYAYLDIGYQHTNCDAYPAPEGDVRIVRGVKSVTPYKPVVIEDEHGRRTALETNFGGDS